MLPEMLLTLGCVSGGCTQTAAVYNYYNPEVKNNIESQMQQIEIATGYTGKYIISTVGILAGKQLSIKIEQNSFIYFDIKNSANLGIKINF